METEFLKPYIDDPVLFAKDIIGVTPEDYQADIMRAIASESAVSVKSGHGTGKTALLSWCVLWFLFTRPFSRVPCTAPTEHQLKDILWAEIAKWLYSSPLGKVFGWTNERVFNKHAPETWFAVARVASKGDALQGFHCEHLMFVIDEASGVRDALFEPVLGALTGEDAKLVMMGNPTQLSGFFYNSHNGQALSYKRFTLNGEKSPRVSREAIKRIAGLYGIDSDPYRVRVLGLFPKAMPDSFISVRIIEDAIDIACATAKITAVDIGVDVARFGDDESVIQSVLRDANGNLAQVDPLTMNKNDCMELVGVIMTEIEKYRSKYTAAEINVKVDADGLGAGVFDRLYELSAQYNDLDFNVTECHFGGKGGKLDDDPIDFANNAGLMWGRMKAILKSGRLSLRKDPTLCAQLTNRKYKLNSEGCIVLERKEDMKKRGVSSPDRADALALALAPSAKTGLRPITDIF